MADSQLPPDIAAAAQQIQIVNRHGLGLSTQFFWVQDRFQHTIGVLESPPQQAGAQQAGAQRTLLASESCAASASQACNEQWPADPPLQQLSVEPIGDRDAVLAVGQAGCGHWSSSVEAFLQDDRPTLKFDIACRFSRPADYLGSQYRLADPQLSLQAQGDDVLLAVTEHRVRLAACAPSPGGDNPLAWQRDPTEQRLWLSVPDAGDRLPRTVRWQFTVTLG